MGIRSREPDPWKKHSPGNWVYQTVGCGCRMNGFLAAHPFGVMVHHMKHSKPCVSDVTNGELACVMCGAGDEPVWRGYTAIYTAEYLRRFVMIPADCLESVREIPIHSQIKISRGNKVYDPAMIRAELWRTLPLPPSAERDQEVDLLPSLLRMWRMPDLVKWHHDHATPKVPPVTVPKPVTVPPAIEERMRPAALPTVEQIDTKLDEVMANLTYKSKSLSRKKPGTNGTHPPPTDD